jgi:hypothetical protein
MRAGVVIMVGYCKSRTSDVQHCDESHRGSTNTEQGAVATWFKFPTMLDLDDLVVWGCTLKQVAMLPVPYLSTHNGC